MTLLEILARELKEWPEGVDWITQDSRHVLRGRVVYFKGEIPKYCKDSGQFCGPMGNFGWWEKTELAADHATAIITRDQWQAAKDKLEGKTVKEPKANKDGFIRHRGGKCPVEAGTLVYYRMRNGSIASSGEEAGRLRWAHVGKSSDIMAYKVNTPSDQPATVKESLSVEPVVKESFTTHSGEAEMPAAKYFDSPLQWRDRIFEIDTQTASLKQERIDLVQKLANEGLQLTGCPF